MLNINYSEKFHQMKPRHSPQIIFVPSIRMSLILDPNMKSEAYTRGVQCINFQENHSNGNREKIAKVYYFSIKASLITFRSQPNLHRL